MLSPKSALHADSLVSELSQRFEKVRRQTEVLAEPLTAEDCQLQSMPDASPAKWHLAHLTWFFETFVLERFEPGFEPFNASFRVLYNSYYNGVGDKYPRPQRGLISRPSLQEIMAYRAQVNDRIQNLLTTGKPARTIIASWRSSSHSACTMSNSIRKCCSPTSNMRFHLTRSDRPMPSDGRWPAFTSSRSSGIAILAAWCPMGSTLRKTVHFHLTTRRLATRSTLPPSSWRAGW